MIRLLATSAVLMTCFLFRGVESDPYPKNRPSILFILMDDLGWNDFGVHDSNMVTPTLDRMYNEAFRLNYTYADPVGSSTRASILSGKFSFKMGLQDGAIHKYSTAHVPLNHTILPGTLKQMGYKTHMIGKWNQGFCNLDQTPTFRGFDTFFGQYTGRTGHSTMQTEEGFYDLRDNLDVMTDPRFKNLYSTEAWGKRTIKMINRHAKKFPNHERPFFIMLSMTAIQGPNDVPAKYVRKCRKGVFASEDRKLKCGMMAAVDVTIFRIMRALRKTKLDENTLIFFTSDNGGDKDQGSSNWPLRGNKGSVWEAGVRVPSFIWSASTNLLPKQNHTYTGTFHAVDWYPTLIGFAKRKGKPVWPRRYAPEMDGKNFWRIIKRGVKKSFRSEWAYMVNETGKSLAYIRAGDFKMVIDEEAFPGWYTPPLSINATELEEPKLNYKRKPFLLFNIRKDPSETKDLSKSNVPKIADARSYLLDLWEDYRFDYVAKVTEEVDTNPANHPDYNGVWSPGAC